MGDMRLPPSVHIVLGPSRIVGASVGIAALGTLAVVFLLPADAWQQAAAVLVVVTWAAAIFWVVALRRGRFAIAELRLAPDLVLVVHRGDGQLVAVVEHDGKTRTVMINLTVSDSAAKRS